MTELIVSEQHALAPIVTNEQIDLIKRTVAKDATTAELQLYLYDCARHGVHPLDRLLHFTKRSGKYTPITSIDLLRSRASDSGDLGGIDDAQYSGEPMVDGFAARVTVYRIVQGQRCPFSATARWSEYKPAENDFMWRKMPHLMLGKCAEALALRKAFPRQLAGLYAKEEMDQADNAGASYYPPAPAANAVTGEITDGGPPASDKQRNFIAGLQDKLNWTSEQLAAYASEQRLDLALLTKSQASTMIEQLRALAEERVAPTESPRAQKIARVAALLNDATKAGVKIALDKPLAKQSDAELDITINQVEVRLGKTAASELPEPYRRAADLSDEWNAIDEAASAHH